MNIFYTKIYINLKLWFQSNNNRRFKLLKKKSSLNKSRKITVKLTYLQYKFLVSLVVLDLLFLFCYTSINVLFFLYQLVLKFATFYGYENCPVKADNISGEKTVLF